MRGAVKELGQALDHVVKAREKLGELPKSVGVCEALQFARLADGWLRATLDTLAVEKEETCEKS